MTTTIPFELDSDLRRFLVGKEPMVFHCHHYNTYLQRTIRDAGYVNSEPFLVGAAAEVAYNQLNNVFASESIDDTNARKEIAQDLYRWAGFGTFDLSSFDENGGSTTTNNSHYAMAWSAKFGKSDEDVCFFASGWLAGAIAAIYDLPQGSFSVKHTECGVNSGGACTFELTRGEANYTVFQSVGEGTVPSSQNPLDTDEGNVHYEAIYSALTSMDISGNEDGHIPAFGVYLTRHYANYYNRISFETANSMVEQFGETGIHAAHPLLVEAGHVCAFNTFGGIMTSSEWDALILPSLESKEDWVHGIVAAVNALGWGRWQVTDLSEDGATFVIHDDYESNGYLAMYGKSEYPISYLAEGAAAGIMNLVYRGDVASKPEFTPEFYHHLFKAEGNYTAEAVKSKAMGDEYTSFRVTRN